MPAIGPRDVVADELARTYVRAWDRIQTQLDDIGDNPERWRKRARLNELADEIGRMADELDGEAAAWVQQRLPTVYESGAAAMANAIQTAQGVTQSAAGAPGLSGAFTWTLAHREAMQEVAGTTYDYLLAATSHVKATTKELIRELVHNEVLQKLVTGETAKQLGQRIAKQLLAEHAIAAVTYKNGARHTIGDYAEMVARSQTAIAYNRGSLEQCRANGVFYVDVFDGPECGWTSHDDTDLANGSTRTIEEAAAFSISHPRCARSFGPRPDIVAGGGGPVSSILAAEAEAAGVAPAHDALLNAHSSKVKYGLPPELAPSQTAGKIAKLGLPIGVDEAQAVGGVTKIVKNPTHEGHQSVTLYYGNATKQTWTKDAGAPWQGGNITVNKNAAKKAKVSATGAVTAPVHGPMMGPTQTSSKFTADANTAVLVSGHHITPTQTSKKMNKLGLPEVAQADAKKIITKKPNEVQILYHDGTAQTWKNVSAGDTPAWVGGSKELTKKAAAAQAKTAKVEPGIAAEMAKLAATLATPLPPKPHDPLATAVKVHDVNQGVDTYIDFKKQHGLDIGGPNAPVDKTVLQTVEHVKLLKTGEQGFVVTGVDPQTGEIKTGGVLVDKDGKVVAPALQAASISGYVLDTIATEGNAAVTVVAAYGEPAGPVVKKVLNLPEPTAPKPNNVATPKPAPTPPIANAPVSPAQTANKLAKLAKNTQWNPEWSIGATKILASDAAKGVLSKAGTPGNGPVIVAVHYGDKFHQAKFKLMSDGTWQKLGKTWAESHGVATSAPLSSSQAPPISVPSSYTPPPKPTPHGTPTVVHENQQVTAKVSAPPSMADSHGSTRSAYTGPRDAELVDAPSVRGAWRASNGDENIVVLTTSNEFQVWRVDPFTGKPAHVVGATIEPKEATQSFLSSVGLAQPGAEAYTWRPSDGSAAKPSDAVILTYGNGAQRLWVNKGTRDAPDWFMQTGVLGTREQAAAVPAGGRVFTRADERALPSGVQLRPELPKVWSTPNPPPVQHWDMDDAAKAAISRYTTSHYRTVNGMLRGQQTMTESIRREVEAMERGISAAPAPPKEVTVRGLYTAPMKEVQAGKIAEYVRDAFPTGSVVQLPGMVSMSYSLDKAVSFSDHVVFEITTDPSMSAYIKGYSTLQGEDEVLGSSESKFIVTEIVENQQIDAVGRGASSRGTHTRTVIRLQQMPRGWVDPRGEP